MFRSLKSIILASFLLFFCLNFAPAEEITITTYYPSPYGSYKNLNIYNQDESVTQSNFTQGVTRAGLLITTDYANLAYTPGIFWSSQDNNPTRPKAGIYMQESNSGTRLYFGTSANYATGITNNAIVINENGYVGIGTTSPTSNFHIYDNTVGDYTNNALRVETIYGYATFGALNGGWFHMGTSLPQFYFNNPCQANGGFSTYSSRDKKQDIRHLTVPEEDSILESLLKIQMSNYRYKDERFSEKVHLGVIAEESPDQILTTDKKAVEMMDYISYAVTAIKSQQRQIRQLQQKVKELESRCKS